MSQEKRHMKEKQDIDVVNQFTGEKWYYSDIVKEHFFHPKNLLLDEPREGEFRFRIGDYRVIFDIIGKKIFILAIKKRDEAYDYN